VRRTRFAASKAPDPTPSVPQLLLTVDRSPAPGCSRASISASGTRHNRNPPTAIEAPPVISDGLSRASDNLVH
jgi:hypothetical protein